MNCGLIIYVISVKYNKEKFTSRSSGGICPVMGVTSNKASIKVPLVVIQVLIVVNYYFNYGHGV